MSEGRDLDPLASALLDSPPPRSAHASEPRSDVHRGVPQVAVIRLEGLSVFGHHGARPYEKEAGQRLEVDLELEPLDARAEHSDRLADAVDYDALYQAVRETVEGRSFHLLEALAAATAELILERFRVRRVRVRIAKQNLGWTTGGRAIIEVVRQREE
jgi:7,8-dihydroneopterin aldolase/epimerase/oxygenase